MTLNSGTATLTLRGAVNTEQVASYPLDRLESQKCVEPESLARFDHEESGLHLPAFQPWPAVIPELPKLRFVSDRVVGTSVERVSRRSNSPSCVKQEEPRIVS